MGGFHATCSLSRLPILQSDPVRTLVVVKNLHVDDCKEIYPIPYYLKGYYNGHGGFDMESNPTIVFDEHLRNASVVKELVEKNYVHKHKGRLKPDSLIRKTKFDGYNLDRMSPLYNDDESHRHMSEKVFFHESVIQDVCASYHHEGRSLQDCFMMTHGYIDLIGRAMKDPLFQSEITPFSDISESVNHYIRMNYLSIDDDLFWFLNTFAPKSFPDTQMRYTICNIIFNLLGNNEKAKAIAYMEHYVETMFMLIIMNESRRRFVIEGYQGSQVCNLDLSEIICHSTLDKIKTMKMDDDT